MHACHHRSDLRSSLQPPLRKAKRWGEAADFLKARQEYINKHGKNIPETQNWTLGVNLRCLLCSWMRHKAKYTAHANPRPRLTTKEQIHGTRCLQVAPKTGNAQNATLSFQQCEKTEQSQRGIWAQMSKVSNTCMPGFMFHLPLSSLSGYFLCGWLAGHCAEVTWEGSGASTRWLLSTLKHY